jgi:hypothetical protein
LFNENERKEIVKAHNAVRSKLKSGKLRYSNSENWPAASSSYKSELKWSKDLE